MYNQKPHKKNRPVAYRRHARERVIRKKQFIARHILLWDEERFTPSFIGKLSKGKVHCSCKMCKFEKHYDLERDDEAQLRSEFEAIRHEFLDR